MKNLTIYYIKKRLPLLLIVLGITIISSLVYLSPNFVDIGIRNSIYGGEYENVVSMSTSGLPYLGILLLILVSLVPIYEFSFKMKKNGCDLFYSLPIKRSKLYIFKYLFGLGEVFSIFLINYFLVVISIIIKYSGVEFTDVTFQPGYLFLYLPIIILAGILLYSWITFFYTRGNTVLDGFISVILASLVLVPVAFGLLSFGYAMDFIKPKAYNEFFFGVHYIPFYAFDTIGRIFEAIITDGGFDRWNEFYPEIITWCLALATIPLFFILSNKEEAEKSEDISDSPFLYKVMIPIYVISLFLFNEFNNVSWIAIVIGGYLGYVIYNRNFLIKKRDLIVLISSIGVGMIFMIIKLF